MDSLSQEKNWTIMKKKSEEEVLNPHTHTHPHGCTRAHAHTLTRTQEASLGRDGEVRY